MPIPKRKFKLSPERQKYVRNRDTNLRGLPVRANPVTVDRYANAVAREVRKMHLDLSSQINQLFDSATAKNSIQKTEKVALDGVAMDASISSMARILTNKLVSKWTKRFNTFGKSWTESMIKNTEKQSAKDLSKSMSQLSGGLTIDTNQISDKTRDKILSSADQSASLIKTVGPNYATEVKQAVARSITDDTQSFTQLKKNIHSMLQEQYKKHKNKAYNVARDQTRKAYSNITASRMKDIGVGQYIWRHGGGVKEPRKLHKDVLNGQVFSLDDPPIIDEKTGRRGKPGDDYFCSCYMEPVITFDNKKAP